MIRSMIAIAAGYFSIAATNGFVHLIVSFYFKSTITLSGVANLPSVTWTAGITALQLAIGLFGGLLASTIADKEKHLATLGLILLLVIIGLTNYTMLNEREPIWYLITAPALRVTGVFFGYKLQIQQLQGTTS
ncbi:hypothetical protein [Fodinibius saliphilus]|uniref:hypothetical protein n=1 Tax=Fodinibius saliphilus TaxID=1920650 RepID=UPI001108FDFB|nr:hypothetical protein [Fodinibius saliphilus]